MPTGAGCASRRIGWAYGEVVARVDLAGATLFETVYRHAAAVPAHEHQHPYFTVLLAGRYQEPWAHGESLFVPFATVFHPAHVGHSGLVSEMGCRFFTLEMESSLLRSMGVPVRTESLFDPHGTSILWPQLRLLREFRAHGAHDSLTLESLVLEALYSVARPRRTDDAVPALAWRRLRERLHDGFREPLRICDLARAAGIHRVHVARLFRRHARMTPGEYLQRLRLQHACRLMCKSELTLGEIASESGFADQSHMHRVMKRVMCCTPGSVRRSLSCVNDSP
jgi:AraC family transcriptional regulator